LNEFEYWIVEECQPEELDEKEIYYIAKYDTYYNGYNSTLGGRRRGQNKYDSLIDNLRTDYINGMSMIDLNIKYRIGGGTIRYFVQRQEEVEVEHTNNTKIVIGYTKEWQRVGIFESIKEALGYVNNQRVIENKPIVDERNFYRTIKTACTKNGIASGYRWQYAEDVFYNGMQFNSSIDKDKYIQGLDCECINNIWFVIKNKRNNSNKNIDTTNNVPHENYKINKEEFTRIADSYTAKQLAKIYNCTEGYIRTMANKLGITLKSNTDTDKACSCCGKMGVYKDNLCVSCYNVKIKGKSPKPSKEQLLDDLKHLNINEIADKYERTQSTIYYWLYNYGIKQKSSEEKIKRCSKTIK
jgi:hypothetical protein